MNIWNDHPIGCTAEDSLQRKSLIDTLGRLFGGTPAVSPLVIGIYGDWGSGKTSVMRALAAKLVESPNASSKPLVLWFDAWKYARSEHALWRALLLCVVETLADAETGIPALFPEIDNQRRRRLLDEIESLRTSLYRSQTITKSGPIRVNWANTIAVALHVVIRSVSFGLFGKMGLGGLLDGFSGRDTGTAARILERAQVVRYREQLTSIEQFQETLEALIKREITERGLTLYIFIDDLDRCLPEEAVGALEAVKLFLDIKGCVFVLGMDREVVERGILARYPPVVEADGRPRLRIDPRQYLDKIIQLPFTLPPLTDQQIGAYLDSLLAADAGARPLATCRSLIELAAPPNPRTLKRVLNVLSLLSSIENSASNEARVDDERLKLLAKIVLMQVLFDDAYARAANDPENLVRLEKAAQDMAGGEDLKPLLQANPNLRLLLRQPPWFAERPSQVLWELICHARLTAAVGSADPSPAAACLA